MKWGAQGGLNWLLNSNNYIMDLGYAVGGMIGYDFVGPRVEIEGMFRSNSGSGTVPAQAITVIGRGEQGLLVQTGDGVREPRNRRVEIMIQ